jgi:hypothetical protein
VHHSRSAGLLPDDFPDPYIRVFDLTNGEFAYLRDAIAIPIEPFFGTMGACPAGAKEQAFRVPKIGAHSEKSPICRQDANFGTPQAGLQAAARLSLKEEHPERLERALADALASGERELVRTALRMLAERPNLAVQVEPEPLLASDDRGVREAAERLNAARGARVAVGEGPATR